MFDKNLIKQYFATFSVNLITVGYGATIGWPSPHVLILQSESTSIETGPLTIEESSWIGAIMCIGALIGTFFFGWIADQYGRKISLSLLSFPQFFSWLLILCNQNFYYLLLSRFLGGLTGGGLFVVIPLYIAEISDDKIRGNLGSQIILFCNSGIVLMFVAGKYLSYFLIPKLMMMIPIIFLFGLIFLPETPYFLLKAKKEIEAENSWKFFNSLKTSPDFKKEIENFQVDTNNELNLEWKDFSNLVARKAFVIGIGLVVLNQFSGCFAILTYTATIFKEAGSDLTPNSAAIVVAFIQLFGSYISTILADKAGRKILLITSSLGSALGLSVMATYGYVKEIGYDVTNFNWIPIASVSFVILIANLGILTLPFVVMSEVMPEKIRAAATTICMSILCCCAFLTVKYFSIITELLAMHGIMYLFAGACYLGAIFIYFFIPETKGKSFDEIIKLLEKY